MADELRIYDSEGRLLGDRRLHAEERTNLNEITAAFMRGVPIHNAPVVTEQNAYQKQVWVFACVTAISRLVAAIPLEVRNIRTGAIDTDVEVAELMLRRPAPRRSRYELIFTTIAHLELTGNALWYVDEYNRDVDLPVSIRPLNPRLVEPVRDKETNETIGYMYAPNPNNPGKKVPLRRDEVIHFKYPNPEDECWGQSPLEAAMYSVRTDVKAAAYNEKFFDNSAQPGGLLLHSRPLTPAQREQITTQFEEEYGGVNQSHRTAVLAGDWTYQQVGLNQRDMDYLNQRQFSREQIAAVFGVPGILINDPNRSNYSTASVEMRLFADSNWVPKVNYLEDVIRNQFFRRYAPDHELKFQTSEAPGLREATSERIGQMLELNRAGIPLADLVKHFNMPFKVHDHMKHWWVPVSMVPANAEAASQMQAPPQPKEETSGGAKKSAEESQAEADALAGPRKMGSDKLPGTKDSDTPTPPEDKAPKSAEGSGNAREYIIRSQRQIYWQSYSRSLECYAKLLETRLRKLFCAMRDVLLERMESEGGCAGDHFDTAAWRDVACSNMAGVMGDILEKAGQMVFDELRLNREFVLHESVTSRDYRETLEEFSQIPETIKSVLDVVSTPEQLDRVFGLLSDRAGDLARAESARCINRARIIAMRLAGVTRHQWIAADETAGVWCGHNNDGEIVPLGKAFSNGLMRPAEVAVDGGSCGCITLPLP